MENFIKQFLNMHTAFYVLLVLLIIFMWKNPEILLMLFVSLVFASSLNPLADKLTSKMSRKLAAFVVLFGSIAVLLLVFVPILIMCAHQISAFAVEFPKYVTNIDQLILKYPFLSRFGMENISIEEIFSSVANYSSEFIQGAMGVFSGLSSLSLYLLITVIFIYFLIADKEYIKKATLKLFPLEMRPKTEGIIDIITQRIGGYVVAQIFAIMSVGIVMMLGLWIFGVPYAFLLGLITAALDIIPVVGPALALIICLVATYEAGTKALIVVTVVFTAAQLIENNFVRPYAFGKLLNLHPMLIFIFLIIGTKYFGIVGTLFAPAIAATVCVLIEELYIKNLK